MSEKSLPASFAFRYECEDCLGTGRDEQEADGYCHRCIDGINEVIEHQCDWCGEYGCQCDEDDNDTGNQ